MALALSAATTGAWDFTYGYRTITAPNAETYLVEKQHVRIVHDWLDDYYWGPDANDVQATLTYKFDFPAVAAEAFLQAKLTVFNYTVGGNFRTDYGSTSLWGSTNGSSWQLLLDGSPPSEVASTNVLYHQSLPASLLGATNLWLQVRMQQHDAMLVFHEPAAAWTDAQFSRANSTNTDEVFQLKVRYGAAAPSVAQPANVGGWSWRAGLVAAAVLVCLGGFGLLLLCLGLLCLLVRRSSQQLVSNAVVLRRLEELTQRLDAKGAGSQSESRVTRQP